MMFLFNVSSFCQVKKLLRTARVQLDLKACLARAVQLDLNERLSEETQLCRVFHAIAMVIQRSVK